MAIIHLVHVLVEPYQVASFVDLADHRTIISFAIAFIIVPFVMSNC